MAEWRKEPPERDSMQINPLFARPGEEQVPRWKLPEHEMSPAAAYQIVADEIMLDGNARQNLATFVTTWMDDARRRSSTRVAYDKNMIDKDEYPQTASHRGTLPADPR